MDMGIVEGIFLKAILMSSFLVIANRRFSTQPIQEVSITRQSVLMHSFSSSITRTMDSELRICTKALYGAPIQTKHYVMNGLSIDLTMTVIMAPFLIVSSCKLHLIFLLLYTGLGAKLEHLFISKIRANVLKQLSLTHLPPVNRCKFIIRYV